MKQFILFFCLIGFSNGFAGQNWKNVGEYFENQYLNSLQEQLKKRDQCVANSTDLLPLRQAFLIYQIEANKGDIDAQFRLGQYEQATEGGHEYAKLLTQEVLSEHDERELSELCSSYRRLSLSGKRTSVELARYVESQAVRGNAECMLELGRVQQSTYWLQKAVLAATSSNLEAEASYQLGLVLEQDEACRPKLVLARMERATRCKHVKATHWLKTHGTADAISAYAQYLFDIDQPIYAEAVLRRLQDRGDSPSPWSYIDRYQAGGAQTANEKYLQGVREVLGELSGMPRSVLLDTLRELLGVVSEKPNFAEPILDLYEVAAPVDFEQSTQVLGLVRTWVSSLKISSDNASLKQVDRALKLRRLLVSTVDVSELDGVFKNLLEQSIDFDEAFLREVLRLNSRDLLLFFYKRIFSNELAQLEISMQVKDLFSGVGLEYRALETFPKLDLLKQSGINLSAEPLTLENALYAESILTLGRYETALKHHQQTGFYFWDYGLETTLSGRGVDAVKGYIEVILEGLSKRIREFKEHRQDAHWLKDASHNRELAKQSLESTLQIKRAQVKRDLNELLATQKTLAESIDYDSLYHKRMAQLKNTKGLGFFQTQQIAGGSGFFDVSPRDAGAGLWGSHHSIELKKGEVLNIQVAGEWSPTCAMERSGLFEDVAGVNVGSEGFRVHLSQGDSKTSGSDQRHSTSQFSTQSETTSFGFDLSRLLNGLGGAVSVLVGAAGGPAGLVAGAAIVGSSPFTFSHTSQTSTGTSKVSEQSQFKQTSTFNTQTAAFQRGYRLKDTPYPQFPAGSYLALVISREATSFGQIMGAFGLGAHSSYIATHDAVIYFVVNDCKDGKIRPGKLSVAFQKLKPASGEVDKLVSGMVDELHGMRRAGDALVLEGGDLSSRVQSLKSQAFANLQSKTHFDLRSEPTLYSVFTRWLDSEADKIVRKARILELAKNIELNRLEMNSVSKQLNSSQDYSGYISSRLNQVVKHVRQLPLYDDVLEAVQKTTRYLLPILHLYQPDAKNFVDKKPSMSNVQEGDDFALEQMATQTELLMQQLLRGLTIKLFLEETSKYVVLRIPRPGALLNDIDKNLVPTISEERARILWDHLFNPNLSSAGWGLKIDFSDLYQKTAQAGVLEISEKAPILADMALLFGVNDLARADYLHDRFSLITLDVHVNHEQNFPLANGPKKLMLSDEALQERAISVGFTSSQKFLSNIVDRIESKIVSNLNGVRGLSPFSAYQFGVNNRARLNNFRKVFENADDGYPNHLTDIFLVMKVVSTTHGKPMTWIKME